MGYIALLLGIGALFPLGAFGYLGDSFVQSVSTQRNSVLVFLVASIYLLLSPRNKQIIASGQGLLVPSILFPPYVDRTCKWSDIISHRVKYDKNGNETLILKTRSGNIKIHSLLCCKNFQISFHFGSYEDLYNYIEDNLTYTVKH